MIRKFIRKRVFRFLVAGLAFGTLSQAAGRDAQAQQAAAASTRAEQVSSFFNRSSKEVLELRSQGFSYAEIVKILVIAEMSRQPLDKLLARNADGYGWGTIGRELGLDIVYVKKRVDQARETLGIRVKPRFVPDKTEGGLR